MTKQLSIPFKHTPTYLWENYYPSPANEAATKMIQQWPQWPHPCLLLQGPVGSGKTHLSTLWSQASKALLKHKTLPDPITLSPPFTLAIDGLSPPFNEETLLHLYNVILENKGSLLITTEIPVKQWNITLPDLRSRLLSCPTLTLEAPDANLIKALFRKQLADLQIHVEEKVVNYILSRAERSYSAIHTLTRNLEKLASQNKKISIPLVREHLFRV